jgi:hypothetical protein
MGSQENSSAKERIQTIHSVKLKDFFYKLGGWFFGELKFFFPQIMGGF